MVAQYRAGAWLGVVAGGVVLAPGAGMTARHPVQSLSMREWFRRFAHRTADAVGSPWTFFAAIVVVLLWAVTGPYFRYSDTWQLIINTGTTILTFLMVFLIQNTQNRDAKAIHLKLDELIRALQGRPP